MPRRPRLHLPGGFYHVILRGNGRQAIFFDQRDRLVWQALLTQGLARYNHRLHAYCWMTNHVHMAIQAGANAISMCMCFLASRYARFQNRKRDKSGHLFERRYKAILVQRNEYLLELVRYIHMNPVRARMVSDPGDYRWSSHLSYLRHNGDDWLTIDLVMRMFGTTRRDSRLAFSNFMGSPTIASILRQLRGGSDSDERALGDEAWIETVSPAAVNASPFKNTDDLVTAFCSRYGVTEAELASTSRSRRNSEIRARLAIAATEQRLASVTEIARRFGRAHSGLSRAMTRLREKRH